jgi:hypothetical protein
MSDSCAPIMMKTASQVVIVTLEFEVNARSVLAYVMAVLPYMYAYAPPMYFSRLPSNFTVALQRAPGSSAARVRHVVRILTRYGYTLNDYR